MSKTEKKGNSFSEYTTGEEIIHYLKMPFSRLGRRKKEDVYLYHYTNIKSLIAIIQNKTWHLSQAQCMNDKLEYKNGIKDKWKKLYFASFILEEKENIGMWSMYGQPWDTGVKISIPLLEVEKWIEEQSGKVYAVNCKTKRITNEIEDCKPEMFPCSVAYSNYDNLEPNECEELMCGTVHNNIINISKAPLLTGYIKNRAWSYEKETRIRAEFEQEIGCQRIAIGLPDTLIDSMVITPSPLFKGNIRAVIKEELNRNIEIEDSLFKDRLSLESDCTNCTHND